MSHSAEISAVPSAMDIIRANDAGFLSLSTIVMRWRLPQHAPPAWCCGPGDIEAVEGSLALTKSAQRTLPYMQELKLCVFAKLRPLFL